MPPLRPGKPAGDPRRGGMAAGCGAGRGGRAAEQWHGMMTAAVAAGDGRSSHGWYRGLAPDCDLVFVQTWDENRRITNASLARALRWLYKHRRKLRLRVVNVSVYGDPVNR